MFAALFGKWIGFKFKLPVVVGVDEVTTVVFTPRRIPLLLKSTKQGKGQQILFYLFPFVLFHHHYTNNLLIDL